MLIADFIRHVGYNGTMKAGDFTGSLQVLEKGPKARIFVPYLNRWSQPDTIVPNAYNPQSLNPYSYVYNNPVNFVDPSGHLPACMDEFGCRNTSPVPNIGVNSPVSVIPPLYELQGNFTEAGEAAIDQATQDVADALADSYNSGVDNLKDDQRLLEDDRAALSHKTSQQAFYDEFGQAILFVYNDINPGYYGEYAGIQNGQHVINVYNFSFGNQQDHFWVENPRALVHEIGHAFNRANGGKPQSDIRNNAPELLRPQGADGIIGHGNQANDYFGYAGAWGVTDAWQFGFNGNVASEEFADMFVGWTYGTFGTNPEFLGPSRANYMNSVMTGYLGP